MQTKNSSLNQNKVGIIAGGGDLPHKIVASLKQNKREFYIIAINGEAEHNFDGLPHIFCEIAQVGRILDCFHKQNVKEIVLAGKVNRPSFSSLKPDSIGVKLLASITKNKLFGDNSVLSTIVEFIEKEGFIVKGAEEYNNDFLTSKGVLTSKHPTEQDIQDIEHGKLIIQKLGALDIGQSTIIEHGLVLGVEAAEGTDELIKRCKSLKREAFFSGCLIKMKKTTQDKRVDLPTIGIDTISHIYSSGFAGIAIESENTLIIDQQEVINLANNLNIFIVSI
jgi:DUF1009 family protein